MEVEGEGDYLPTRAHVDDAGMDLRVREDVFLAPGERRLVPTGVKVGIPSGFFGLVAPRSGMAHKVGVTLNNAPGVIDAGYRGEVMLNLINHGGKAVSIKAGGRVAQLIILPVVFVALKHVLELSGSSARGDGGHGSTGVK